MYRKTISISTSTVLPAAFFAAISAVALVVSFMAASYLYARSTLIPYGVLLALSFILIELMIVVYFFVLSEFSSCLFGKKKDTPVQNLPNILQATPAQLIDAQANPVPPVSDNISPAQPVNEEQTEKLQVPDQTTEEPAIPTSQEPASLDFTVPSPARSEETISKIKPRMRHLINVKKLHFLCFEG